MGKLSKKLQKIIDSLPEEMHIKKMIRGEKNNIKKHYPEYKDIVWTDEQKKKYDDFWLSAYGEVFPDKWHKWYQSANGIFNERYFPEILLTTQLEPLWCPPDMRKVLANKSLLYTLYKGAKGVTLPASYVMNVNGLYFNGEDDLISEQDAVGEILKHSTAVLKPTGKTGSGKGVMVMEFKDGTDVNSGKKLKDILDIYGRDFVVQEKITPHPTISCIYPKSLNTIRTITYFANGGIHHVPLAMRIGRGGKLVDNIHAGGLVIALEDDGRTCERAFDWGNNIYYEHPDTKVKFKGLCIAGTQKVIAAAKEAHKKIPQIGIASWDFTVNDKEEPVLIELNLYNQSIWFPQIVSGKSAFGENMEYILKVLKDNER